MRSYTTLRQVSRELNSRVMKAWVDREALFSSGKALGILRDNVFVFSDETEQNALMDFALHEYRKNGKNAFQRYSEATGRISGVEKEILDAFAAAYTSLFAVVSVSPSDNTLMLDDILGEHDGVKLTDIGFSETAIRGLLMFVRIVPFKDLNMTSGVAFVFPGRRQKSLLKEYERLMKKLDVEPMSARRFVAFFELYRRMGLETRYQ